MYVIDTHIHMYICMSVYCMFTYINPYVYAYMYSFGYLSSPQWYYGWTLWEREGGRLLNQETPPLPKAKTSTNPMSNDVNIKNVYLCVHLYTDMHTHTAYMRIISAYVRMYVCMYVRTYVRTYVCTYVRIYVCTYVCMYVCMHARVCICTCAHIHMYMHICMYIYMYTQVFAGQGLPHRARG